MRQHKKQNFDNHRKLFFLFKQAYSRVRMFCFIGSSYYSIKTEKFRQQLLVADTDRLLSIFNHFNGAYSEINVQCILFCIHFYWSVKMRITSCNSWMKTHWTVTLSFEYFYRTTKYSTKYILKFDFFWALGKQNWDIRSVSETP